VVGETTTTKATVKQFAARVSVSLLLVSFVTLYAKSSEKIGSNPIDVLANDSATGYKDCVQ